MATGKVDWFNPDSDSGFRTSGLKPLTLTVFLPAFPAGPKFLGPLLAWVSLKAALLSQAHSTFAAKWTCLPGLNAHGFLQSRNAGCQRSILLGNRYCSFCPRPSLRHKRTAYWSYHA